MMILPCTQSVVSISALLLVLTMGTAQRARAQEVQPPTYPSWQDSFEKTRSGSFPTGWVKDANASDSSRNRVQTQQRADRKKALQLHGVVGGCWGALAYRELRVKAPFEISLWVRNGTGKLSGCHPHRGGVGLRLGKSWRSPSRNLLLFDGKGQILGSDGKRIAGYKTGRWYHIAVRYRIDGEKVVLDYVLDGQKVSSCQNKRIEAESRLRYLELSVQEGEAWFDGVVVRGLRSTARPLAPPACKVIAAPSDYVILVSAASYQAWGKAVRALQKKRRATILVYPREVTEALKQLAKLAPRYACFVARPEEAGRDFVVQVHRLCRALDADPYGDCIWGILTGYEEADLLRTIADEGPLIVRKGAAGCSLPLEHFVEGQWWSEGEKFATWRKEAGGKIQKLKGPGDTTTAIVAALSGPAELFVTSGHATERDWQIGYGYKNGQLRCHKGVLYGLDLQGSRHPVSAEGPRIYSAMGNCLMGWIADRESMALAWMHSAGVRQMSGYVVSTWYGYGGWGVNEYFYLGRHDFAESFFLNNQALLAKLMKLDRGAARLNIDYDAFERNHAQVRGLRDQYQIQNQDTAGLLWDRDTVAFYGDPAWVAKLDRQDEVPYEQSLRENAGVFTFEVRAKEDGIWKRPPAAFLPHRIQPGKILEGEGVVTDNFVLMPLEGAMHKGRVHRVRFRARRAKAEKTRH